MASSQKMASLVTKIARTGVVAAPEAKWVPAQVRSNMLFIEWSGIDINDIMMYAQFEMLRSCYPKNRNGCQQRSPFRGALGKICLRNRWGRWNEKKRTPSSYWIQATSTSSMHNLVLQSLWCRSLIVILSQDLTVSPLPKERWNSTAATCSSNSIGPLCSDVIERNWMRYSKF